PCRPRSTVCRLASQRSRPMPAVDRATSFGVSGPQAGSRKLVARSTACIGLLRWDAGRWSVQPLAVQTRGKGGTTAAHTGDWAQDPTDPKAAKAALRNGDPVAVLRERAGRLLRR